MAARISRALRKQDMRLKRSRCSFTSSTGYVEPGDYYVIDASSGLFLDGPCDLADLAREFLLPTPLDPKCAVWRYHEVQRWIEERTRECDSQGGGS
jgi:hypothetical protein